MLQSVALQTISDEEKKNLVMHVYKKLHKKYFEQKALLADNQLAEVSYESITGDPLNTLGAIYDKLEIQGFDEAYSHFRHYIDNRPKWEKNEYATHPSDIRMINKHWGFAFDSWGYAYRIPQTQSTDAAG